jgi:5-formyltetrahydrofolate cyclo-ligase
VSYSLKQDKKVIRAHYRSILKGIDDLRREEASLQLPIYLRLRIKKFSQVLSFSSFKDEINTGPLNQMLLEEGKLSLPKIEGKEIVPYHVTNLVSQLKDFGYGFLEPDPKKCTPANNLHCILVPGIVFDKEGNRIGYGKGYYDHFIAQHLELYFIAIGFREQLSPHTLPIEPHDQSYKELCLV